MYECSAEISIEADDVPEYVVCQSVLLHRLYPALLRQHQLRAQSSETSDTTQLSEPPIDTAPTPRALEFYGHALLFFACHAPDSHACASILASIASSWTRSEPIQFAFNVLDALSSQDSNYVAFFRFEARATTLQRAIMRVRFRCNTRLAHDRSRTDQ